MGLQGAGGVIITVLDNKTVNVCYGDVVTLHATVVADGVLVAGQKLFFVIDNVEYIANSLGNGSYIASYEVITSQGINILNPTTSFIMRRSA